MLLYSEHLLKTQAKRFVNKIWVLDNSQNKQDTPNLNILPNGCFNIAIVIGNGASIKLKNTLYSITQNIYLCSQVTENVSAIINNNTKIIIIQLHAWAFSMRSRINFNNFLDQILEIDNPFQFLDTDIDYNSSSILQEIITITETYFENIHLNNLKTTTVEKICNDILAVEGNCILSDIYRKYNYSSKWMQTSFKKATGLTPKKYSKIIQFRLSVDKIVYDKNKETLTKTAYKSGYSDQSHFIKNFQCHSKINPTEFNPKRFILSWKR